jgi:hypothetical protein
MTQGAPDPQRLFPNEFNDTFDVGPEPGNKAFFGLNVLQGLVDGIDDFINESQQRWGRPYESLAPALFGSAMWIDDPSLLDKISELEAACVVVTKQKPKEKQNQNEEQKQKAKEDYLKKLRPLAEFNKRTPGMPVRAFPSLSYLAPRENGKPAVLGPSSQMYDGFIPTIRTLGFRGGDANGPAPIIHAKLILLGSLWWHDEHPLGHPDDIIGFDAKRLWISSANFTRSSRRSLEFGYWTEEPALVQGADRFLVKLMGSSEPLDPSSDVFDPELVEVEFDDDAMAEALSEYTRDYQPDDWELADWDHD